jgi:F-type H+-transporting ATPase subunit b
MRIDWWTLGIQTANVAILVWLLQRFFWRPVAAVIEARRTTVRAAMTDAQSIRSQAAAAMTAIEKTRAGFAAERETILAAARSAAEQTRAGLLADATRAAAELEAAARAAIERERQAAEAAWAQRSTRLAVEIASRLATRLDGAAVRACFLDWLVEAINALPEAQRQASGVEVVSATPLNPVEQQHASAMIDAALGSGPVLTFRTDPALIAGLELHAPHLVISNSWRADLAKILEDLTDGS